VRGKQHHNVCAAADCESDNTIRGAIHERKSIKTEDAWREQLDESQFSSMPMRGTERPFTRRLITPNHHSGVYHCVACDHGAV